MTTEDASVEWTTRMTDVDHTHPQDDPAMRAVFQRGRRPVATDGGRREASGDDERPAENALEGGPEMDGADPTMREVSHTPSTGDGANEVFQRGQEATSSSESDDPTRTRSRDQRTDDGSDV
ncbi:MAG: hypothetical protein R3324_18435 [Halobacteriales archaeon]|nr:hypothetical protein [Halobacteriales archaeon]